MMGFARKKRVQDALFSRSTHPTKLRANTLLLQIQRMTNIARDLKRTVQVFQFLRIGGAAHVARNFRVPHGLLIEVGEIVPYLRRCDRIGCGVLVVAFLPLVRGWRKQMRKGREQNGDVVRQRAGAFEIDIALGYHAPDLVRPLAHGRHQDLARPDDILDSCGILALSDRDGAWPERGKREQCDGEGGVAPAARWVI